MARVISDFLDKAYKECPEKIAFEDKNKVLTYSLLYEEAQYYAGLLHKKGVYHQPVLIFLPNCVTCASYIYATSYSGNYTTICDFSIGRVGTLELIEDFSPAVILTNEKGAQLLREYGTDIELIVYEDNIEDTKDYSNHISLAISIDPLVIPYTSGSTGRPKGAVHTHSGLIEGTERYSTILELDEESRVAEFSANMYGIFYMDLFNTVHNRAYEYIFSQEEKILLLNSFKTIANLRLNRISCISVLLEMAKKQRCLEDINVNCLSIIAFVGATISAATINYWRTYLKDVKLRQYYGASEAVIESFYEIERNYENDEPIPLGRGFADNELMVVNEQDGKAVISTEGELYIRSSCLAIGYYKNVELTHTKFVQNPFHNDYRDVVYKTGDIVKFDKSGCLVFVGRSDSMVKRRGYRIELGEIDAKLSRSSEVDECISLFDKESELIYTFYEGNIPEGDAYKFLKSILRATNMPDRLIRVSKMPHGKNYKIDRTKLMKMVAK